MAMTAVDAAREEATALMETLVAADTFREFLAPVFVDPRGVPSRCWDSAKMNLPRQVKASEK